MYLCAARLMNGIKKFSWKFNSVRFCRLMIAPWLMLIPAAVLSPVGLAPMPSPAPAAAPPAPPVAVHLGQPLPGEAAAIEEVDLDASDTESDSGH